MSDQNNGWNPEDGPPPTDDELAEAHALAEALSGGPSGGRKRRADPDVDALVAVALRVQATAHPDAARSRAVAASAVDHAIASAEQRWYRSRWSWLAGAALLLVGLGGGVQWALTAPPGEDAGPLISHPATDVFDSTIRRDARSEPIGRIVDARMGAYRDVLLGARGQGSRRAR